MRKCITYPMIKNPPKWTYACSTSPNPSILVTTNSDRSESWSHNLWKLTSLSHYKSSIPSANLILSAWPHQGKMRSWVGGWDRKSIIRLWWLIIEARRSKMAIPPVSTGSSIIIARGKNNRLEGNSFIKMKRIVLQLSVRDSNSFQPKELRDNSVSMRHKIGRRECLLGFRSFSSIDVLLVSADFNKY